MVFEVGNCIIADDWKEVYDFFGMSATCPKDVKDFIKEANGEPIEVKIGTCYGGDVYSASEIYTDLKDYEGGVKIKITGLAASAASHIAMAGECEMSPTAQIMVHNVSTFADGDYHEMDKASNQLKQTNKSLASAYSLKSGMSEEEALKMMDEESWITADEALEKGLIDKVMFKEDLKMVASIGSPLLPQSVIDKVKNEIINKKEPDEPDAEQIEKEEIAHAKAKLALTALL